MSTSTSTRALTLSSKARALVSLFTSRSTTPLLPFIPKPLKALFLLIMILNASSWPFLWHLRVWYYPLRAYFISYTRGQKAYWLGWRKQYEKQGGLAHMRTRVWRRALLDDCDYNMHLSNSCYAKNSDACKMKFAIEAFAPCFKTGLHMALGASHWQYLREIPVGSSYLIESRIAGWGEKWVHIVTEFIIYPKKGSKEKHAAPTSGSAFVQSISAPASASQPDSGADTPETAPKQISAGELAKKLQARAREPRSDGGVVACIAVTDYCFKHGRVTIPPRIVFHLSLLSPEGERRSHALTLLQGKDGGAAFARGGWKSDPLADEFGRDIALGSDGGQGWAELASEEMDKAAVSLGTVGFNGP